MFAAVLDTSVLWPSMQRDFLLSLAAEGSYRPLWSSAILDELVYHEAKKRVNRGMPAAEATASAQRLVTHMTAAFDDALVSNWEPLDGTFGLPDLDDEHVLAAAVIGGAEIIVTDNLKDFPADALPSSIRAVSAREFAYDTVRHHLTLACRAVLEMSERSGRHGPRRNAGETLAILEDRYAMGGAANLISTALGLRDT